MKRKVRYMAIDGITWTIINPLLKNGKLPNIEKLIKWYESIFAGYPHDASMAAALSHGYRLTNQIKTAKTYQKKFEEILSHSTYWKTRVKEFPEILEMAGL